jgi:peptide/nickel transport system ATP-binding protein
MYAGRIVEEAPAADLFADPAHPYTRGLIGALPRLDGPRRRLTAIAGGVPDPRALPPGCAFAPRCLHARAACAAAVPAETAVAPRRRVACILAAHRVAAPAATVPAETRRTARETA